VQATTGAPAPVQQVPVRHCASPVQAWPLLSRHAVPPKLQVVFTGSAQLLVVPAVHVVAHAVALAQMRAPPQAAAVGAVHPPALSQLLAGVSMLVAALHEAPAHAVADVQQLTLQTCGDVH
jgi:hypothetical protein